MTAQNKVRKHKMSLLELARDLNNVLKACPIMGYSRQQLYEIKRNYQTYGAEGLVALFQEQERHIRIGTAKMSKAPFLSIAWLSRAH